jgi:hypothetical protein
VGDLLRRVVDGFGNLVTVSGARSEPVAADRPARFEQYTFQFERGTLTVAAVGADDSIRLVEEQTSLEYVERLSESAPWAGAIGHGVLFAWQLTNHAGFADGVQIEFGWASETPSGHLRVQLVCEASELTAAIVRELDGQFDSSSGLLA